MYIYICVKIKLNPNEYVWTVPSERMVASSRPELNGASILTEESTRVEAKENHGVIPDLRFSYDSIASAPMWSTLKRSFDAPIQPTVFPGE